MKTQHKRMEELLERFLDGKTTNAEEKELYAFFAGADVPEHLEPYRAMFAWFDGGLEQEIRQAEIPAAPPARPKHRLRIWGTVAAVAATIALILLIRPTPAVHDFDPFEGSYIVRNGVRITDPDVIRAELEGTLEYIQKEEEAQLFRLYQAYEGEAKYMVEEWNRTKDLLEFINSFPEGEARQEAIRMILLND